MQGRLVQVREAQRQEQVHRLLRLGHDVNEVDEAEGLLPLILVELARPWNDKRVILVRAQEYARNMIIVRVIFK